MVAYLVSAEKKEICLRQGAFRGNKYIIASQAYYEHYLDYRKSNDQEQYIL